MKEVFLGGDPSSLCQRLSKCPVRLAQTFLPKFGSFGGLKPDLKVESIRGKFGGNSPAGFYLG